jgi:hypothetical protein
MNFEALEDILWHAAAAERPIIMRVNTMDNYTEKEFQRRYHLSKATVLQFLARVDHLLSPDTFRSQPISALEQLLITLRILTGCSLQHISGDLHGVSQATVSRIFSKVVKSICQLRGEFIRMPTNITAVKNDFFEYGSFPGVVACVDGTHIPITKPKHYDQTEIFRCRKGYYSINAQIVCGPEYLIYDIVARWPGSTHDSRVFQNSSIRSYFEDNNVGLLLADSGYPCRR